MKYEIDYEGLETYLKTLKHSDFEKNWRLNSNKPMKDCVTMSSIERFNKDIPKERIIEYGMPFLVDAIGNDLSIMILTRRAYKLPDGRLMHAKFVRTIIQDCNSVYGTSLNGYWIIPSRFIKSKK